MWRLLPAFLLPIGAGVALMQWVWPGVGGGPARHLLKASLAVGCGIALSSCTFFLAVLVSEPSRRTAIAADALVLLGALGLAWRGRRAPVPGRAGLDPLGPPLPPRRGTGVGLRFAVGVSLAAAAAAFLLLSWIRPHGEWDAWAFWNLRARFLFAAGADWRLAFDPLAGPHPDYPVLLPGAVARAWLYAGQATVIVPVALAMLFTFATVGLAAGAVTALRGGTQGMLAALVLLGSAGFTAHGTMQYADVLLAFFVLATLVLLWLHDRGAERGWRVACLAGATTGFAAWTKNEGLLLPVAILGARLAVAVAGRRGWRAARELAPFGAGLAPVLALVLYFKLRLAPPTLYLLSERLAAMRDRAADPTRYTRIGAALVDQVMGFGDWIVSLAGVLLVYALVVGVRVGAADRRPLAASLLALATMLAGYLLVFLLTVQALDDWLGSGLARLLLHLWPGALFVYWTAVRAPDGTPATGPA